MSMVKHVLKKYLPGTLVSRLRKLLGRPEWEAEDVYGWSGDYADWERALKETEGYGSQIILSRTLAAARQVKDGTAAFERDSVVFMTPEYDWALLFCLMHVAAANEGELRVIDFGGALGSSYFQNRRFLDPIREVTWCVVEQPAYVDVGQREFADSRLSFTPLLAEAEERTGGGVILMSAVLAYMENPYKLLAEILTYRPSYLVFNRTGFTCDDRDRLTIQRVPPVIYSASYPCWFLSRSRFLAVLGPEYEIVAEFMCADQANIPSEFRGFLMKRKGV